MRVKVEKRKKIRGKVGRERAKKLSRRYNEQYCYLLQTYDQGLGAPVGVIPVKTKPTFMVLLKEMEQLELYPLILPQPVYVPKEFWKEYRTADNPTKSRLIKEYGLLKDEAIYRYETVVIDIDSPFESVYPAWEELKERLGIDKGYQVYKTKSGRFRAYVYLIDGTKDFKRARELLAIIYAYFESKGLNADHTFVYRLNHPVFYEDYPLYTYTLIDERDGGHFFFKLYRKVKKLQKEEKLYTFNGKNLTEEFWGIKPPAKGAPTVKKECRIIKAPAFLRKLRKMELDALEVWKRAVRVLYRRRDSYRYIYVIQPAIGWAKYLELPKEEVDEFLLELFGNDEKKRKDIEKAWKYARELPFDLPEEIRWWGRSREDWESIFISKLRSQGEIARQELLKDFYNQKWLLDMIAEGLEKKGVIESFFVKSGGRGRPRKYYRFAEQARMPLEKAVGCEEISQVGVSLSQSSYNKQKFVMEGRPYFSHIETNSLFERAIGGGWERKLKEREIGESVIGKIGSEETMSHKTSLSGGGAPLFGSGAPLKGYPLEMGRNPGIEALGKSGGGAPQSTLQSTRSSPDNVRSSPTNRSSKIAVQAIRGAPREGRELRWTGELSKYYLAKIRRHHLALDSIRLYWIVLSTIWLALASISWY